MIPPVRLSPVASDNHVQMATYLTEPRTTHNQARRSIKQSLITSSRDEPTSSRSDRQTPFVVQPKDDFQAMMLLSALLLLPSMASALTEAGYGTQLKRSYTPPTSELSDLRNFDQISYLANNHSLVRCLSICVC
jgi:hypothetical protein